MCDYQDFKPLILRKTIPKNTDKSVEVKQVSDRKKKADFTDVTVPKTVGSEMGKRIQQARTSKNMTQKDLAQKLNVKQPIIRDYENGTAVTDSQLLSKIKRILGL